MVIKLMVAQCNVAFSYVPSWLHVYKAKLENIYMKPKRIQKILLNISLFSVHYSSSSREMSPNSLYCSHKTQINSVAEQIKRRSQRVLVFVWSCMWTAELILFQQWVTMIVGIHTQNEFAKI